MAENKFSNDDFEDIFSNSGKSNEYEDISSSSGDFEYEDISSFSSAQKKAKPLNDEDYISENFRVKYNSAVQNRQRQEIQYDDISEVYDDMAPPKKKRKKSGKGKKILLVVLCVILVLTSCLGIFGYSQIDKLLSSFNNDEQIEDNKYISENELYQTEKQINILLVGVDAREEDVASRSDTMMLVTLDNVNGEIKLTSFLRDSYVEIAGFDRKEKLNAAYFRGGIQTLIDTLEMNFKVSIPYYVVVDFNIFTTIVDELGGVDVEVTKKESDYTKYTKTNGKIVKIPAGESVHLNGEQALWYSRMRKLDSDFMRTQRQRKVISAIVSKAKTKGFSELYSLAQTIFPLVATNMSSKEMMKYGTSAMFDKVYSYSIVQHQIPADGTWTSKSITSIGSCLVMDMDENVEILHSFLKEKQDIPEESTTKSE